MTNVVENKKKVEYRALTVQALHMRNEIWQGGGINQDEFENTYLNGMENMKEKLLKKKGLK